MEADELLRAGLRRVALDLHVHSPASHDWRGGDITPEQLVERALEQGLDGIAITDHQSGEWLDRLKLAASSRGFTVIPGVEVNNLAGNEGIHLIVLFDVSAAGADVELFLGAIGCISGTGDDRKRGTATKGILEVLDEVKKRGAIAVLAHSQSSKGSLADMRGDVRTELVRHPAVLAAEATAEDYFDIAKQADRKRTYDLLDGHDPNYRRKLAVYQSSDNPALEGHGHSLDGIGSRFTYFYVEPPITLESLRQCFIDRETRLEYPAAGAAAAPTAVSQSPCVRRVEVGGGFLDGLDLELHEGLTTVLGSKGSGKSLLIELMRFALGQSPDQDEIRRDHDAKLKKRLGDYARVTVTVRDSGGTEHRIEREFSPATGSPYHGIDFEPSEFFRCHFLSQGEIVRLAESESDQIRFIDSFFDFYAFRRDIDDARAKLAALDKQVAAQIVARKRINDLDATKATLAAQIAEKDQALTSPLFAKYRGAQVKTQLLGRARGVLETLAAVVDTAKVNLEATAAIAELPDELKADQLLQQVNELAANAKAEAIADVGDRADALRANAKTLDAEIETWQRSYEQLSAEYTAGIAKMGGDAPALSQERSRLVAALEKVEQELLAKTQASQQLTPTVKERDALLAQLQQRQADYTQARRDRCSWFESKSDGQIRASVQAASNYGAFCESLTAMKKGSYLSAQEIETIATNVAPSVFVRTILRYDLGRKDADLADIQTATGLPIDRVRSLAEFLLTSQEYEALLDLEYSVTPTDRPEIKFRREDGSFAPLTELSTGQKATAFLIMALCEGDTPIIVDQPEDSLDIRSIWDDMCMRLRLSKRARQFVFTTHNSSLAVASDSDKFVVLVGDATHGEVALSGAIDSQPVRKHVLQLLEGGADTYFLKQRKYNVHDPSHD